MIETPEQYTRRILGNIQGKDPLAVLKATPDTLSKIIKGHGEERLRRRPDPGKWSVAEIVIHLAEVELVVGYRVRMLLANDGCSIQAFDQDQWAKRYDRVPTPLALLLHRTLREANLALYISLSKEEWSRYGIHSERGRETIDHIVKLAAGHDLNHLKQVEGLVGTP